MVNVVLADAEMEMRPGWTNAPIFVTKDEMGLQFHNSDTERRHIHSSSIQGAGSRLKLRPVSRPAIDPICLVKAPGRRAGWRADQKLILTDGGAEQMTLTMQA
ncbi:MAG: hypothetical protein ACLTSZ_13300 [Lachnospiraceae bacterium]